MTSDRLLSLARHAHFTLDVRAGIPLPFMGYGRDRHGKAFTFMGTTADAVIEKVEAHLANGSAKRRCAGDGQKDP